MACCCHQPCISYDGDCYCIVEPQEDKYQEPPEECPKRRTLFEIQGIFPSVEPKPIVPGECYRPQMKNYWHPPGFCQMYPSISVTEDSTGPFRSSHSNLEVRAGKMVREVLWMTDAKRYDENRGPILRICGKKTTAVLTYKEFMKLDSEGVPVPPKIDDTEFYPQVEDLFLCEELGPFAATTKCKQVRCVILKNEGTVAVRYQWLRSPPTRAMRRILARPGSVLNVNKLIPPTDNPFFWKDDSFEFHFRELPGVILPGQSIQFPFMFRPRRIGYFYENVYLLTHPRLSNEDDYVFKLRLSGICMDPDCSKSSESVENISRKIRSKVLYNEASDCLDGILDIVLYNGFRAQSTLPLGKVIAEKIFYQHNRNMHYRYGVAEKALESVRKLVQNLVPKDRIIDNDSICPLSISNLYSEIALTPTPTEFFWDNFKNPETEETLKQLSEQTQRLFKPRVFAYPTIANRLHSACYTTMVSTIDEIVANISNVDVPTLNDALDQVLRNEIRNRMTKGIQKERRRQARRAARLKRNEFGGSKDYYGRGDTVEFTGEFSNEFEGEESETPMPSPVIIPEEDIEAELKSIRKGKDTKNKEIIFETLFGCGIERMMSVVDSYRAMYDYRQSETIKKCEGATCSKQ